MKDIFAAFGFIVVISLALVGLPIGGYYMYNYLAPKYEATRRDVMIESRMYQEGSVRELYTLQRQYEEAKTDSERAIIAAAARHEFAIFPKERLPGDLQGFVAKVGGR